MLSDVSRREQAVEVQLELGKVNITKRAHTVKGRKAELLTRRDSKKNGQELCLRIGFREFKTGYINVLPVGNEHTTTVFPEP